MPRQQAPVQTRKPAPNPAPVQNRKPAPQGQAKAPMVKKGPDSLELLTLYLSKTFDTYLDSMAAVLNETIDAVEALRDSPKEFLDNWYATYTTTSTETEDEPTEEEPEPEEEPEEEPEDFYDADAEGNTYDDADAEGDTYDEAESYWEDQPEPEPEPEPVRAPVRQPSRTSPRQGSRRN